MSEEETQNQTLRRRESKLIALFTSPDVIKRTISAIALGAVTLALAYHSFEAFLILAGIALLIMCWEWAKLTNNDTPLQILIPLATIIIALTAALIQEWPLLIASLIAGGLLATWSTHYWWRSKWALIGLAYLFLPLLSLIYLRSDAKLGFFAVLFVLLIVWATDTAAYFSGRYFGGKKLAPAISPKKTWAGFYGGLFAGFITGVIFAVSINQEPIILSLIGLFLAILSQLGDLAESAVKRHFGVKDSGALIPGHGGVLDRLDGVIFASIGAALIAACHNFSQPGQALLIWSS